MQDQTFPTEINQPRPMTNSKQSSYRPYGIIQPSSLEESFYVALKQTREQAKRAQQQYQKHLSLTQKLKRSVDRTNHKSLIKRVEFLKIYGNKKAMYKQRQLIQNKKHETEKMERKSIDLVKRRKLESQLQHILRQNQEEDHICQLQSTNRKNRQAFQRDMILAKKREIESRHHDEIKRRNNEFMIRKRNMHTSQTMRSRNNYCEKVQQELKMISHYAKLMGEVGKYLTIEPESEHNLQGNEPSKDNSTLNQSIQHGPMFITSRNTLS